MATQAPVAPNERASEAISMRVEGLSAFYGAHRAIENVNMVIEPNAVTAIIGPSGCGKSTLIRCLNRIHEVKETRPIYKRYGLAVGLTVLAGGFIVSAVALTLAGQFFGEEIAGQVGLREDVDGGQGEPGRSERAAAADALRVTWGEEAQGVQPVSVAIDRALPQDAVVWLGSSSERADLRLADRPWELLQGVRAVALPFSDRLLRHLP